MPQDIEANFQRFDDLGLETAITELDVRFTLPPSGIPTLQVIHRVGLQ